MRHLERFPQIPKFKPTRRSHPKSFHPHNYELH
jgi:hypothetical protein